MFFESWKNVKYVFSNTVLLQNLACWQRRNECSAVYIGRCVFHTGTQSSRGKIGNWHSAKKFIPWYTCRLYAINCLSSLYFVAWVTLCNYVSYLWFVLNSFGLFLDNNWQYTSLRQFSCEACQLYCKINCFSTDWHVNLRRDLVSYGDTRAKNNALQCRIVANDLRILSWYVMS